jgi:hypothetical protein
MRAVEDQAERLNVRVDAATQIAQRL